MEKVVDVSSPVLVDTACDAEELGSATVVAAAVKLAVVDISDGPVLEEVWIGVDQPGVPSSSI